MRTNDSLVLASDAFVRTNGLCDSIALSCFVRTSDAFMCMNDAFVRTNDALTSTSDAFVCGNRSRGTERNAGSL
jgi:hypothetical protein